MSKIVEHFLANDKIVRCASTEIIKSSIDQLTREDLTTGEKNEVAENTKHFLETYAHGEEGNSKFWYEYGQAYGKIKGMLLATGLTAIGYAIGCLIAKHIKKE